MRTLSPVIPSPGDPRVHAQGEAPVHGQGGVAHLLRQGGDDAAGVIPGGGVGRHAQRERDLGGLARFQVEGALLDVEPGARRTLTSQVRAVL